MSTEYSAKIILNLSQVRAMRRAQQEMYDKGINVPNEAALALALSPVAGILSLVFIASTAPSAALGTVSVVAGLYPQSEKDLLKALVYEGYWQMGYLESFLMDNPNYDMMEVLLPFIQYQPSNGTIRFVTGAGVITRVHSGSGWILS